MNYKFFAIPARNPDQAEAALNAFCNRHLISFIEKQLIADGADSYWSICITYMEGEAPPSISGVNQIKPAVDYKQIVYFARPPLRISGRLFYPRAALRKQLHRVTMRLFPRLGNCSCIALPPASVQSLLSNKIARP